MLVILYLLMFVLVKSENYELYGEDLQYLNENNFSTGTLSNFLFSLPGNTPVRHKIPDKTQKNSHKI